MTQLKNKYDDIPFEGQPWFGFDLDGTITMHPSPSTTGAGVGLPIKGEVYDLFIRHCMKSDRVKIMTARAYSGNPDRAKEIAAIHEWLEEYFPKPCHNLEVTSEKDYLLIRLYDDRAVQVIRDTGELVHE